MADPATRRDDNPYLSWIEMYAGDAYQAAVHAHGAALDRLWKNRAGGERLKSLERTFEQATRLEVDFWQMGLDVSRS